MTFSHFAAVTLLVSSGLAAAPRTPQNSASAAAPAEASGTKHAAFESAVVEHPTMMPRAIASFGAAAPGDGYAYVYGGHVGRAHAHSKHNVVGSFRRLNLLDGQSWEELPAGPALQGTALVSHDGDLWRIGGVTAHNEPHDDEDMVSTASVQRFDVAEGRWTDGTPLPSPRSSHDAWVVGDHVYVVGGWNSRGAGKDPEWHADALVACLNEDELVWRPLPAPPFTRRALAVAAVGQRYLVAMGGITSEGKVSRRVDLLDLQSETWTQGPDFVGMAFGPGAVSVGGNLYASGRAGFLMRLDGLGDHPVWATVRSLTTPRFFHRLVAADSDHLLVLGGVGGGHARTTERVSIHPVGHGEGGQDSAVARFEEWRIPFAGDMKSRFGLTERRGSLYLMGGNRRVGQHHFGPEDFSKQAWRVDLSTMSATRLPDLPAARQSLQVTKLGKSMLVFGGFAADEHSARAFGDVFQFETRSSEWFADGVSLPKPRSKFHAETVDDAVWIFGGTDHDGAREEGDRSRFLADVPVLRMAEGDVQVQAAATQLPRMRRAFGAARVDDQIYFVGGIREGYGPVSEIDVFDVASKTWSTAPDAPATRLGPQVASLGGKLYVAGGSRSLSADDGGGFEPDRSMVVFDPSTGQWSTVLEEMPFSMSHVRMLAVGSRLLFVSTHFEDPEQLVVRALDPVSGQDHVTVMAAEASLRSADH